MHKFGWKNEQIEISEDKNYRNIEKAYQIIEAGEEEESDDDLFVIDVDHGMNSYDRAARVAAAYLRMTEPIMKMPEGLHAVLAAMPDNAGVKGDVRDIRITIYASESKKEVLRELGISCKNNHEAVKHPRITEVPDFAKEWTKGEFSCSEEFLDKMKSKGIKLAALSSYYHSSEKKKKYENIYVMNYSFVDCEKMEYVAKMITQVE